MPRRGRTASPAPAMRRAAPSSSSLPARTAPAAPPAPVAASPMAVQQQQPSMFKQMAATAGGVAVGSAVGHTIGAGLTGLFSGGSSQEAAPAAHAGAPVQQQSAQPNEPQGPCAWEVKQFLQCAQNQADITICEGFNEALRQCKQQNHIY